MDNNRSKLDSFPRDIIADILRRLPVESLFRLKSLNKSWYFFILCLVKDPKFVSEHLRCSESSPTTLVIYKHDRVRLFTPPRLAVDIPDESLTSALVIRPRVGGNDDTVHCDTKDLHLPHCLTALICRKTEVYCCNGIVILSRDSSTFTLYNPLLCDEFDVFNPSTNLDSRENIVAGMGFGCDSTGSVYKVVRFFENKKAEVFVPGGDRESWREINIGIELEVVDVVSHMYLNGNCFWLMFVNNRYAIICFDVGGEVFYYIPLPEEAGDRNTHHFGCCNHNNSICVFFPAGDGLQVWALDVSRSGGCGSSWKKLLVGNSPSEYIVSGTFWKHVNDEELEIELYNVYDGEVKSLSIRLVFSMVMYFDRYVESLVSVKSLNKARRT